MKDKKRKKNVVVGIFVIAVISAGLLYAILPRGVPEDVEFYNTDWNMRVLRSDGRDIDDGFTAFMQLYQNDTLIREDGIEKFGYNTMSYFRITSQPTDYFKFYENFEEWTIKVLIANGTVDTEEFENNEWIGVLHFNQFQNLNTWIHYGNLGALDTYGFQLSEGGYMIQMRFYVK